MENRVINFMFKIFKNSGVDINHQVTKEIAKPAARAILKERSGEETYKSADPWYRSRVDWQDAQKNSQTYKKDYERTAPDHLTPQVENELWKRAKQLKDEFTIGMLSRAELHPVKGFMDNGAMKWVVDDEKIRMGDTIRREAQWLKDNNEKIAQFKNLMRQLDPDNPNAGDVERYRPNKGTI